MRANYIMSDRQQKDSKQTQSQNLSIKLRPPKSISKQHKNQQIQTMNAKTLSVLKDFKLFQYPRGIDSFQNISYALQSVNVCTQLLDNIGKKEEPEQLLSEFFTRKFKCVYNRFNENPILKHDLTILIRSKNHSTLNQQLNTLQAAANSTNETYDHSFSADFEGGNLHWVFKTKKSKVYYMLLQNDINTHGYNQWFHFSITAHKLGKAQFLIANLSRQFKFATEMALLTYEIRTGKYQRKVGFSCAETRLKKCDRNIKYWSLHFEYEFEGREPVFFSLSAPYSYSKSMRLMRGLLLNRYENVSLKLEEAARSQLGNTIVCLKITGKDKGLKKTVLITARQHPGETVGSFVCEQIISLLVCNHPLSVSLLSHFNFVIFPMINPDGVIHGNSRTNIMGYDLNRCWNQNGIIYSKQCQQLSNYISNMCQKQQVDWSFDLHGHSRQPGYFAYFSQKNDCSLIMDNELQKHAIYQTSKSRFELSYKMRESVRGQLHQRMKIINSITIQTSQFGWKNQLGHFQHFQGSHFKQIAQNLLHSLIQTHKAILDNKVKQSLLISIDKVTPQNDFCIESDKQKDIDSDSNPQQDYLREQQRININSELSKSKPLFIRRFKTQKDCYRPKIFQSPSQISNANCKIQNKTIEHQVSFRKPKQVVSNISLKSLSRVRKTDKSELFNLTFFASRIFNTQSDQTITNERQITTSLKINRQAQRDRRQSSKSQDLKQSLQMRRCIRNAFSNRTKKQSSRSRQGNDLQIISYPTQQKNVSSSNATSFKIRRNQMKELRRQQYGQMMITSLSKAFSMRFCNQQYANS